MNTANNEIMRPTYVKPVAVIISLGKFSLGKSSWVGVTTGASLGIADWLRVRRIARRRVVDCSLGSGRSFEWTSMTKTESTTDSRPADVNK